MPELPEVEIVRRQLETKLIPQPRIKKVKLSTFSLRFSLSSNDLKTLQGEKILAVRRKGKYLFLQTSSHYLLSHLGMTGSWRWETQANHLKHDHVFLDLEYPNKERGQLIFHDPRRFGFFQLISQEKYRDYTEKKLGWDPITESKAPENLFRTMQSKKTNIKNFLLDQKNISGLGNIYIAEILFLAKVRPQRKASRVTKQEFEEIIKATQLVLEESILKGGSTISDYKNFWGKVGTYQQSHLIYQKKSQPCPHCGTKIKAQMISGRSSFWCPKCQS